LKNLRAQAKAVLVSRFTKLSDYNIAVKQAPFFITTALRAHKAFTLKIN
jgi:hypothetical protein